eukprot:1160469-Pelagomonas_calceolata.AAC.13
MDFDFRGSVGNNQDIQGHLVVGKLTTKHFIQSEVCPQAKNLDLKAPGILHSPAAPLWHLALQPASSNLLLATPGVRQDIQRARRWLIGAWPVFLTFVRLCQ